MGSLIEFAHVSYRYIPAEGPAIPALQDVSLQISDGEFVAVVGANGSGKSTFARLTSALLIPTEGSVRVTGLDTREGADRARIHAAVGMVFQFPEDQVVSTTVEEDAAFGPENLALPPEEIRQRVESALREVGMWDLRRRPPHLLSAGQIQRLALAGVLAMHPRCVIFDEASTMLDPAGRRALIEAMQRLHAEGVTILMITHFMEEAVQAERVIVFSKGQVALDGPTAHVFADQERLESFRLDFPTAGRAAEALRPFMPDLPGGLLTLPALVAALPAYTGAKTTEAEETVETDVSTETAVSAASASSAPVIDVSHLGYTYLRGTPLEQRALDDVSLQIPPGQVHGLLGMTGSGKSTLMQHLNSLLRPQEGQVRVAGFDLNDAHVDRRAVVRKVGLVFQNPETQFFEHFVGDEIAYGPRQLKIEEPLAERVRWAMEQVGLDFETYKDRPLFALSGGERRKVALASTLALRPSVLLLDEPTAGLDPYSRHDLLEKLAAMRDAGMTLVLSSHQMGDMAILAQGLTVFQRGRVIMDGSTQAVFSQPDALLSVGLESPVSVRLAQALREKGWPIPAEALTIAQIVLAVEAAQPARLDHTGGAR